MPRRRQEGWRVAYGDCDSSVGPGYGKIHSDRDLLQKALRRRLTYLRARCSAPPPAIRNWSYHNFTSLIIALLCDALAERSLASSAILSTLPTIPPVSPVLACTTKVCPGYLITQQISLAGMCGLVGIWRHDGGEADLSAIACMLAPIEHRGPDGKGVWQGGRIALGHLRLAILDLTEASHEPMLTTDGTGALVYNGEVYNYREIREALEQEGVQFRSSGDTEVVLQALHRWGPERAISQFNGMFAFAYFNRREDALWLARDRMGIKPLLVADTGTEFIFGSEAKALLAHPRMQKRVDRYALTKWILSGARQPKILFEGIDELRPGFWWKITSRGIDKHQYFHALTEVDVDRLVSASAQGPNTFVRQFRHHLKKSVKLHLASDVPLAVMCSGGVDFEFDRCLYQGGTT